MSETRKTKTTKTLSASELGSKLAGVVDRHAKIGKRAGELAARHYAGGKPPAGTR